MRAQLHSPPMARRLRQLPLLLTACAVVIIVAGCGGGGNSRDLTGEPFSEQNEMDFNGALDKIGDLVAEGDCDGAQQKLDTLTAAAEGVPSEVDQALKDDLVELLARLGDQIQGQCDPAATTTTTTAADTTTSADTTTTTEEQTGTGGPTETTGTAPEQPQPPTTPPGQGGTPGGPPPSGGSNPGGSGGTGGSGGIAPREPR